MCKDWSTTYEKNYKLAYTRTLSAESIVPLENSSRRNHNKNSIYMARQKCVSIVINSHSVHPALWAIERLDCKLKEKASDHFKSDMCRLEIILEYILNIFW